MRLFYFIIFLFAILSRLCYSVSTLSMPVHFLHLIIIEGRWDAVRLQSGISDRRGIFFIIFTRNQGLFSHRIFNSRSPQRRGVHGSPVIAA